MKLLLAFLFFFPLVVLATDEQEAIINSLTDGEGTRLILLLDDPQEVTSVKLTKYEAVVHGSYKAKYTCRDVVFTTKSKSTLISACKVGGYWFFLYD
jgi:hypothetical protein